MAEPWIRLYTKILRSEIMDYHANTLKVFIVLLGMAKWREDMGVERGCCRTTLSQLAHISRLSINSVRGTIKNLEKLKIITYKGTRYGTYEGTYITILNYDQYQTVGTNNGTNNRTNNGTGVGDIRGDKKDFKMLDVKTLRKEVKNGSKTKAEVLQEIQRSTSSFKVQDLLMDEVFEEGDHGAIRSKSISEQVIERRRAQGFEASRTEPTAGEVFARIRALPALPLENKPDPRS